MQRSIKEKLLKTSRRSYGQGTSPIFSLSALDAVGQGRADRY